MTSKLEQLKKITTVVADTGDIEAIKKWLPEDATTNPSLLLKASELEHLQPLLTGCLETARNIKKNLDEQIALASDLFSIQIGQQILQIIPGKVSTEVDSRLSFQTDATINKAQQLISLYESEGVDRSRVLIKIAATWEGIKAAEVLEKEEIHCNLTLLFSFWQAVAAAEAHCFLISPFVGRILDWYKKTTGKNEYLAKEDPGVLSVQQIYRYYKQYNIKTIVMGASFRNTGEIEELAGCDRLTISPALLEKLDTDHTELTQKLSISDHCNEEILSLSEAEFRWCMNEDAMATEKLAEGIRNFTVDQIKLEEKFRKYLKA